MEAPAVTRYRRPFLAPLWLTLLAIVAVLCALGAAFAVYRSASTTIVVLVQPAQKEAGTIEDPPLSPAGEQRAQMLAQMLGEATSVGRLDALFVSDSRRAQQIIAPLADRLRKQPVIVQGGDAGAIASRITREHGGRTVLFVGNGANVSRLVHELGRIEVRPSNGGEHDTLYVVAIPTFGRPNVLRMTY
jgi:phosphohistidine phosphatase SixA